MHNASKDLHKADAIINVLGGYNMSTEMDKTFVKEYKCPVCEKNFKTRMVRAGKVKNLGTDEDLRPRFENIDVVKYEALMCNNCGYASLLKTFDNLSPTMRKLIREGVCKNFVKRPENTNIPSYDDAIDKYKLALLNSIVKRSKVSEQAYACLKIAWLYRGKCENLPLTSTDYIVCKEECERLEKEYIGKAYSGFNKALSEEHFPICGMDEGTVLYILAVLARKCEDYTGARQLIGQILFNRNISAKIKEKARDLKEILEYDLKGAEDCYA